MYEACIKSVIHVSENLMGEKSKSHKLQQHIDLHSATPFMMRTPQPTGYAFCKPPNF